MDRQLAYCRSPMDCPWSALGQHAAACLQGYWAQRPGFIKLMYLFMSMPDADLNLRRALQL